MKDKDVLKITEIVELQIKRFYLPIKLKKECPRCGKSSESDLSMEYLSYPTVNGKESIPFYCDACDSWFAADATLRISIEVGDTKQI